MTVQCSICLATRNKAEALDRTLRSIRTQKPAVTYELIVTDDGSTDGTADVCDRWGVDCYTFIENDTYRNPSVARNEAYREARGDVVICQSDDVMHASPEAIQRLTDELRPGHFIISRTLNWHVGKGQQWKYPLPVLTGRESPRPFFFLGSVFRRDLYAVGGNSEDFVAPAFDDDWFGDCLIRGLKLTPVFHSDIIAHHQHHERPRDLSQLVKPSRVLYKMKVQQAEIGAAPWQAIGGPWPYESGRSFYDVVGR